MFVHFKKAFQSTSFVQKLKIDFLFFLLTLLLFRLLLLLLILLEIFMMVLTLMRIKARNAKGENPLLTLTGGHFCLADRITRKTSSSMASSPASFSFSHKMLLPTLLLAKLVAFKVKTSLILMASGWQSYLFIPLEANHSLNHGVPLFFPTTDSHP